MNTVEVLVSKKTYFESLWFAISAGSQTYPRTEKSAQQIETHLWRIFTGKLGELTFLEWALQEQLLEKDTYQSYRAKSLSIYYGTSNVDVCDLIIKGRKVDIKTAPKYSHKYLIVPIDQWHNQPKDIYVGISLYINEEKINKQEILLTNGVELNQKLLKHAYSTDKFIDKNILHVKIHGYLERESSKWKKSKSRYCRWRKNQE